MVGGITLGLVGALGRLGGGWIGNAIIKFYIDLFRSVPLAIQLIWIYFALPIFLNTSIPRFWAAGIAFALYEGSFFTEIFRAGILSLPKGQRYAAAALGMRPSQMYGRIILPQAGRLRHPGGRSHVQQPDPRDPVPPVHARLDGGAHHLHGDYVSADGRVQLRLQPPPQVNLLASYPWHWQIIWEDHHLQYLLGGIKMTVLLTVSTFASGLVLAFFIAASRLSRFRAVRWTAYLYVEFFRTMPLLLGLLWVYYGLPTLFPGWTLSPFLSAYLLFSLNIAAILSEALRAGVLSLGKGQRWAAASLGMRPWQISYRILMPQALRRVVPVLGSTWVALFKDTSLVFVIGISEITYRSNALSIETYRPLEIFTATLLLYFLITWPQARGVDRLYDRYRTYE